MQVHMFYAGPHTTQDGRAVCESCGGVRTDRVHRVPEVSAEARELDARRIGEGAA